jgi:hypothetical protein
VSSFDTSGMILFDDTKEQKAMRIARGNPQKHGKKIET